MSQKTHGIEFHRLKGVKRQSGRFVTNGAANPTVVVGSGFTVTRIAVGTFRITFDGPYKTVLAVNPTAGTAPVANAVRPGSITQGATSLAQVELVYSAQDPATFLFPDADSTGVTIHFSVDFLDIGAQLWPRG